MARLEVQRFIAATPERVWEVVGDFDRQREWMVDLRELRIVSEVQHGVGTVFHVRSELFGLPVVKDVMTVTRWEPPWRFDVAHSGQFHGTGHFLLDPVDNGVIFTWIEEFRAPLGPLGELAWRLVVRPHLMRVFARSLENVRRLAEDGSTDLSGHAGT